jgi:hypothetical protein
MLINSLNMLSLLSIDELLLLVDCSEQAEWKTENWYY